MKKNFLWDALIIISLTALVIGGVAWPLQRATWGIENATDTTEVTGGRFDAPTVSLAAVGDIMLSRKVGRYIDQNGTDYPVREVAGRLAQADITFGNLESPIGTGGRRLPGKGIWFRAEPWTVSSLVYSGFDVVSVANNHALDYDSEAFLETLSNLKDNNIRSVGGGENIVEARKPAIIEENGLKIGFLAYSEMADIIWSFQYPRRLMAEEDQAGIAPAAATGITDVDTDPHIQAVLEDVKKLVPKADVVIVSLHWGQEYNYEPLDYQRQFAYRLIDAGVDLIVGHHPHTLQGLERYKQGLIAYSLGNFIFDQSFSQQTSEGLMLEAVLSPVGVKTATISPVLIKDAQAQVAEGEAADRINGITARLSQELGLDFGWQSARPVLSLKDEGAKI